MAALGETLYFYYKTKKNKTENNNKKTEASTYVLFYFVCLFHKILLKKFARSKKYRTPQKINNKLPNMISGNVFYPDLSAVLSPLLET